MVKITLLNGTVYEGTIQSVDPVSKIIVLSKYLAPALSFDSNNEDMCN